MKESRLFGVFVLLAVFVLVGNVNADNAASKSVMTNSKAKIVTQIALVNLNNQGLEFGVIAIGNNDSRIQVTPTLIVTPNVITGDAIVLNTVQQKAATFRVSGTVGQLYSITLPTSATLTSGSNSITVDNFSCSNGTGGVIGTDDDFYVGAQLLVLNAAVSGSYHGTFNVTVAYN